MTLDLHRLFFPFLLLSTVIAGSAAARSRIAAPPSADPSLHVSQEIPMSESVEYVPGYGSVFAAYARVALAPDQSLVVWGSTQAMRLSASGERLDELPLTLPLTAHDVVWDAEHYLIAGTSWNSAGDTVDLVALSMDGRVESVRHIEPTYSPGSIRFARRADDLALAWIWRDRNGVPHLKALVVDRSGLVLARYDVADSVFTGPPSLTAGSDGYLLLWSNNAVLFDRVSARVVPLPLDSTTTGSDAAWNGSSFFVAATTTTGVSAFSVSSSGVATPAVPVHTSEFPAYRPSVAYDGTGYRLLWKQAFNAFLGYGDVRIDFFTNYVSANGAASSAIQLMARTDDRTRYGLSVDSGDIEFRDGRAVLAWTELAGSAPIAWRTAYAATFDAAESITAASVASRKLLLTRTAVAPSPQVLVARPGAFQSFLRTASNLVNFSIDRREGAARIDALPPAMRNPLAFAPLAKWNGVNTTVVWSDASDRSAWAGEVDLRGNLLSSFPIPVSRRFLYFNELVCGPNDCLANYTTVDESTGQSRRYYIQRLAPSGAPLDAPVEPPGMQPSSPSANDAGYFSIAPLGSGYLVVMRWGGSAANMTVASFYSGGGLSDVVPLVDETSGAVAFVLSGGDDCLVGIRERTFPQAGSKTTLVRIDKNLHVLARTAVPLPQVTQQVWDGRNWIFGWTDPGSIRPLAITAARVRRDLSDLDVVTLLGTYGGEGLSGLASAGDGSFVMLYGRPDYSPPCGGARRSYLRWVDDLK